MELVRVQAKVKVHEAVVVFVHHFGGQASSVRKHQEFISDLGLDSIAFSLTNTNPAPWKKIPYLRDFAPGVRERWRLEIGEAIDQIPEPKILFSFSFPSSATVEAMAIRLGQTSFLGWVADGGPFFHLTTAMWNYFTHQEPVSSLPLRMFRTLASIQSVDFLTFEKEISFALDRLPPGFPVLSIRYWQDKLVPIAAIDAVFREHEQLKLETLSLARSPHIAGLFREPEAYRSRVSDFILSLLRPRF